MGKKLKKGTEGDVTKYIARTQAVRKLQISLSQFRKLCILKGIYPVEPKNKRKVQKNSTALKTFYYRKDISYLMHEPILGTLRQQQIYARKLGKAIGKKEYVVAKQIQDEKPVYTLDHIIKERYPTFMDAIRDLDDAISMIALFSTLPSDDKVHGDHIRECQKLLAEFQHYVILAGCLKKVFLSIKGIYYQVEIKGQPVTWITPYQFSTQMPHDVDFKVMSTFLEVHETLLSFVNYKLYAEMNLVYPPKLDAAQLDAGAEMDAYLVESRDESKVMAEVKKNKQFTARLKTLESKLDAIEEEEEDEETKVEEEEEEEDFAPEPVVEPTTIEEQVVSMPKETGEKRLFEGCVIWLSREVPRYSLEFIIKSAGGKVGWDETAGSGSQFNIDDNRITHQITDRPLVAGFVPVEGREYLQPQWIYDCINANKLVKTDGYHPGEKLPPHLSPFVVAGVDDYSPENPVEDEVMVEEEVSPEDVHVAEVQAEQAGIPFSEFKSTTKKTIPASTVQSEDKEAKELSKMMMSKRERKVYDKIQFGKARKQEAAKKLKDKRLKISK